ALKILTGAGEPAHGKLTTYNALTAKWQTFRVHKNPDCGVCGKPYKA
ncbi:TPA: molybdopterin-synthase adenylyltransferase MoeB, partial [Enterococcus faecium]|nr:molybdopterin-synthase adenylyltransferase MoeB [Enterococcus faecium]